MIMNSWVSRITILINYFIGNEIFNKSHCRSEYIVCLFNGTNNNLLTCIPSSHIKKSLPFSLHAKTLAFFKINTDSKREIARCLFPDRPPFCFLLGMAYIFFINCLLVAKKKPPSCTHLLIVNLFHLEKEETKLISHNSSFPSPCVNWTPISLCNSTWCNTSQSRVASSIHVRCRKKKLEYIRAWTCGPSWYIQGRVKGNARKLLTT